MIIESYPIWLVIIALGIGSFGLRFSFLAVLGAREIPDWALRHLRYTAVAILPGLVAPLVLYPAATGGELEPARVSAALATLVVGIWTKNVLAGILAGFAVLYGMLWVLG